MSFDCFQVCWRSYRWFWSPVTNLRFRWDRRTFLDQRIVLHLDVGPLWQLLEDDLPRFLRSSHRGDYDIVDRQLQFSQALTSQLRLLSSKFSEVAFSVSGAVQVILSMPDQDDVPNRFGLVFLEFLVVSVLLIGRRALRQWLHEAC